jgi:hypothetical protein
MIKIVLAYVFVATAWPAVAQQTVAIQPTVPGLLNRLKSATWTERSNAFGEATKLLGSGTASASDIDQVRVGVIQLLIKENNGGLKEPDTEIPQRSSNATVDESYGEDKSEYYAGLVGFVADLNDERTIPALLGAASTGNIATRAIARFGKAALGPTLSQVKSQDSDLASGALFVIREMLQMHTASDSDSQLQIKNALILALASPAYRVRKNALLPIEYLDNREEFVPVLQDIAEHDPYKLTYSLGAPGNKENDQFVIRHRAQMLLRKIANHEAPSIDRGISR